MTGSKTKYFNNETSLKLSKAKNCLIACGRWETFIRKVVLFLPPRCPQVLESSLSAKKVVWRAQTTETKGNGSPTTVWLFFCVRLAKSFKRDFILRAKISNDFRKQDASEITHQTEQNRFKLHHAPWNRVSISNLREIHLFSFKQQNLSNEWLLPEK